MQWFKILNYGFMFGLQALPEDCYPVLAEDDEDIEEVSQSVPSDMMSSQSSAIIRDVIVIDTDSESRESKDGEEKQEDEGEEEEEEEDEEEEGVLFCLFFTLSKKNVGVDLFSVVT